MRKRDTMPGSPRSSYSRVLTTSLFGVATLAAPAFGAEVVNPHAQAIDTLADQLATRFVDPATGRRYADMLHAKLAAGEYDRVGDAAALAQRLTQDLQAVAADGHLRVDVASAVDASGGPGSGGPRRVERAPSQAAAPAPVDPPSVAETRWIADGVAYIRFNQFAGEPASVAAVQAFVDDYAAAKAVVIDTRTLVRGGGMAEMDALFAHLFDRETVLVEMATAKRSASEGGPRPAIGNTLHEVAGPAGLRVLRHLAIPSATGPRLAKAKVFYLTSKRTRSAGEHFALALQRTHRGTLIGERTAGANHFGGFEPIGAGLVAFIPVGRTYDPDTGKDWEGTGIVPDVEVPAGQALDKALALAKE